MEKIYRLLDWLTLEQAVDWLQDLTDTQLADSQLAQLCESRQCNVYMNVDCLHGWDGNHEVCGNGIHRLLTASAVKYAQSYETLDLTFEGPVFLSEGDIEDSSWGTWQARVTFPQRKPCFKPSEIQALAAKINGVAAEVIEIDELRCQLEQERIARKLAEDELSKRRTTDGDNTLEKMRLMLKHDHKEFSAMQRRAENAEALVATTGSLLTELRKQTQRDALLIERMTERMRQDQKGEQSNKKTKLTTIGLTFPYSTRELKAIHAAALKFWKDYTLDKRQPTQKEVGYELCELLGLPHQSTGEPARKAMILATAIKPDTLPDA